MMKWIGFAIALLAVAGLASAAEVTVKINQVSAEGVGKEIGTIHAMDTEYGVVFHPKLSDLPPGLHGFHVHENANCAPAEKDSKMTAAHAAGGHYDPQKTGKHLGPYEKGHLGDLPPLYVGSDGKATHPVLAPRLKVEDLKGKALMIHAGGDNYSDQPEALGGGGERIACGPVQ